MLSDAEQKALYALPDFDDGQQLDYLSLSEAERALATSRPGLHAQVYGVLQIGYFKAKQALFHFDWGDVEEEAPFVLSRYFNGEAFEPNAVTDHQRYTQRRLIAELFGYLRESKQERNVHRSQNRIESCHQLRSAIAQVGGKKELTGRTDIEIEINNQCARLIANAIIYCNSAILSLLLTKYEASGNAKALALSTQISPAAWWHILLNGHYTFYNGGKIIELDAIVAGLELV